MIEEIQRMMDGYLDWLKERTGLKEMGEWVEITAPLLDRHNDYLQIYVRKENGHYVLTDDGHTLNDLDLSGCSLDSPKRQDLLNLTLRGFGVEKTGSALSVRATQETFALKKHSLLQAMLGVNDLFYVASPHVASLFYEDVLNWLNASEIRYVSRVKFTGKTGYDHLFDFVIPRSKAKPERILKPISNPDRASAMDMVFAWLDTKEARPPQSVAYAILNDSSKTVREDVMEAFRNYQVVPILWSKRDSVSSELAS
jgi:hypothetical protein